MDHLTDDLLLSDPRESEPSPANDDRIRLTSLIRSGAIASIYQGVDNLTGRRVEVKVMSATAPPALAAQFRAEAQALVLLDHPSCVSALLAGETEDDLPYLAMEVPEGARLDKLLANTRALDTSRIHSVMKQVLAGLAAAHDLGIVHGGLDLSSVIIERVADRGVMRDRARVFDFGLANTNQVDDEPRSSRDAAPRAPELGRGDRADARTDVYACGVILFRLLANRWPAILHSAHAGTPALDRPPNVRSVAPAADLGLSRLADRALSPDPGSRFPSARAMLAALEAAPAPEAALPNVVHSSTRAAPAVHVPAPPRVGTPPWLRLRVTPGLTAMRTTVVAVFPIAIAWGFANPRTVLRPFVAIWAAIQGVFPQ